MHLNDEEIVQNIRKGEKHLFAHLVDRHKDRAMALAMRMVRNREDAEEATQDAFVRAYHGLERFEGKSRFSTWLYRIVYNVCLSRISQRKHQPTQVDVQDVEEAYDTAVQVDSPEVILESRERWMVIKNIIDSMEEKYSSILSLFYFQELSYEEICEVTQLPLGTVKAHLFRARTLLRKRLSEELKHELAAVQ